MCKGDSLRYIRLNTVLKFSKESNEQEFKARKPQIRDSIIGILNSKRPEDLLKIEGKKFLKEEFKAAINSFLVDGHVIDVFYVNFSREEEKGFVRRMFSGDSFKGEYRILVKEINEKTCTVTIIAQGEEAKTYERELLSEINQSLS